MKKFLNSILCAKYIVIVLGVLTIGSLVSTASADHSWGGYHWARTTSQFNLKLGNNLSPSWQSYLSATSLDWNTSEVLDTTIVSGQTGSKRCKPTLGRDEICNGKYGNNGWLGIAQIWVSGSHITQGLVKMNDTYFNNSRYNTPAWKQMVVCQEVAHTFGLDHQDEDFGNINLGTCMDYTNDPAGTAGTNGTLNNLHPNQHDFDEFVAIYNHLDSTNTTFSEVTKASQFRNLDIEDRSEWGKEIKKSKDNKYSLFERDFGRGEKVYTFVTWAVEVE